MLGMRHRHVADGIDMYIEIFTSMRADVLLGIPAGLCIDISMDTRVDV